jgi:soluble lytic murein transglycosylase-like protein
MNQFILIAASILGLFALFRQTDEAIDEIEAEAGGTALDDLYEEYGASWGLDPKLLKAVAQVESAENPNAKNPTEPSYGLMQIYCVDDGTGSCANNLNIIGWPPAEREDLFDPNTSLYYAAQILAWNIENYGFKRGIAIYNSWSARKDPKDGPFVNQGYVDKVLGKYRALGGKA